MSTTEGKGRQEETIEIKKSIVIDASPEVVFREFFYSGNKTFKTILLHLLDHFERHDKFIEFMKNHEFLDLSRYETMVTSIEKFQKEERNTEENNVSKIISLKNVCGHLADNNNNEDIIPKSNGCEECEKEHAEWIALRLCLSCGHVGCCDSSKGMHATKHFVNTTHPLITI